MVWKPIEILKELELMEKFAQIFSKLCEFMGLIGYLMRQFVGGERNF